MTPDKPPIPILEVLNELAVIRHRLSALGYTEPQIQAVERGWIKGSVIRMSRQRREGARAAPERGWRDGRWVDITDEVKNT